MAEAEPGAPGGYVAFISYSHRDAAMGRWLHRRLEGYRLPKRLVGTQGEEGEVPPRLTPIFRDRDELPAAGDLSEKVRAALAVSRNLIVLCSPHSAGSPWVAQEIATFRELHPDRLILTAIVEGEPDQCFPPPLREGGVEPLAADLRKEGDGRRLGLLKLVAALTGVGLDDLVQRDATRRVRRVTYVTATAVAAMLAMALLTAFALNARAEAQRQRAQAEGLVEFMLTDLRDKLKGVGRIDVLTAVNQRALDYYRQQRLEGLPPDSLERRARILHAMGEDDEKLGNLERALVQFEEAKRTTAALVKADPDNPERIFAHSQSEYWIGSVAEQRGHFDAAMGAYQRYREAATRMYQLAPKNSKYVGEVAYAESNLGIVELKGRKRPDRARPHFERSLQWFQRASAMDLGNPNWREEIGDAHAWIANTWFDQGRFAEARSEHLRELAIKQALLRSDPKNRAYLFATVITTRSLARIDLEQRRYRTGESTLHVAAREMEGLLRIEPRNTTWRDQAAMIQAELGKLFIAEGRRDRARQPLAQAEALLANGDRLGAEPSSARQALRRRIAELVEQTKVNDRNSGDSR